MRGGARNANEEFQAHQEQGCLWERRTLACLTQQNFNMEKTPKNNLRDTTKNRENPVYLSTKARVLLDIWLMKRFWPLVSSHGIKTAVNWKKFLGCAVCMHIVTVLLHCPEGNTQRDDVWKASYTGSSVFMVTPSNIEAEKLKVSTLTSVNPKAVCWSKVQTIEMYPHIYWYHSINIVLLQFDI